MGIPVNGEGIVVYNASGIGTDYEIGTALVSTDQFVSRIKRDIHVPEPIIEPILFDVIRDFTEKTWILCKSFQVQGRGIEASGY